MLILGLILAAIVGVSLGLLGAGGSILAVPILVYVAGLPAKEAIATALVLVGATALVGALNHARHHALDWRGAATFGGISMLGAYAGGRAAEYLPDAVQLTGFAAVMIISSVFMFRRRSPSQEHQSHSRAVMIAAALSVGVLTGILGVGGGFLIVPALTLFARTPIRNAVGTSLVVIAINSASGLAAWSSTISIDWMLAGSFTASAMFGVVLGALIGGRIRPDTLRLGFATFLLVVGSWIAAEQCYELFTPARIPAQERATMD